MTVRYVLNNSEKKMLSLYAYFQRVIYEKGGQIGNVAHVQ
jgi:hypothetical protein